MLCTPLEKGKNLIINNYTIRIHAFVKGMNEKRNYGLKGSLAKHKPLNGVVVIHRAIQTMVVFESETSTQPYRADL